MDEKNVKDFFRAVYVERGYRDLDEIKMSWTVVRSKYSLEQIAKGLNWITENVTGRPSSTHFKQALEVDINQLVQKAMESIGDCLRRHGYNNPGRAKEELGDALWASIGYSGGYQHICRHFDRANTGYMAQLRDRLKANILNPKKFQDILPQSKEIKKLIKETNKALEGKK